MTIGKVHLTKKYARYRIVSPKRFKRGSFRTQKIGTHGTKRIAGVRKSTGRYSTQAILIPKSRYKEGERVIVRKGRASIVHRGRL